MNMLDVARRIVLVIMLMIVGFLAPLWVTVALASLSIMAIVYFVEAVIIVMIVEFISRDFVGFGVIAWFVLLWLLVCESRRRYFTFHRT